MKHVIALLALLIILGATSVAQVPTTNATAVGTTTKSFSWDPNTEPNLAGYHLYFGEKSRVYSHKLVVPISPVTPTASVTLTNGTRWFFAVTAVNVSGLESEPSNEVIVDLPNLGTRPSPPGNLAETASVTTVTSVTTISNVTVFPYKP